MHGPKTLQMKYLFMHAMQMFCGV